MLIDGETIVVLRQSGAWVYLVSLFQLITNKRYACIALFNICLL